MIDKPASVDASSRPAPTTLVRVILFTYIILAVLYSVVTPIFEAPDENYHFAFIQRLALSPDLPVQDPAIKTPWFQEGSQPPLYYFASSLILRLLGTPYRDYPLKINPHAQIGIGLAAHNRNFFVHTPDEAFPWHGVALAVHLVRFFSIALGAFTIFAVYQSAQLALPDQPVIAPLAMAFAAFNPMFIFMTASVNNDDLVTALSAGALWLILLILQKGWTTRRIAILALLIALASISKLSGLTLYLTAGLLFAILIMKRRIRARQVVISVALVVGAFAILAAWWYIRNQTLYGDLTGLRMMIAIIEPRKTPYTILTMLDEMQGLRISFWALFGWFNVIGADWFLSLMDVLTALALLGGIIWAVREIRARRFESMLPVGLVGAQFLITFVSLINWTRLTPGTQGRLLFPALPSIAILMVLGWSAISFHTKKPSPPDPSPCGRGVRGEAQVAGPGVKIARPYIAIAAIFIVFAVALLSPFLTIAPAYALPPTVDRLPDDAVPVAVRFDTITVVGFRIDPRPVAPGGTLPITLYYRGEPDPRNLSLYLTALDLRGVAVGKIDSYPGGGNLATSFFEADRIYADTYLLPIAPDASGPMQARIEFGWWDYRTGERLNAVKADGSPLKALILRGGVLTSGGEIPPPGKVQRAVFSGALELQGYTLSSPGGTVKIGDELDVSLLWNGLTTIHEDFTVFVHLETPDGKPAADADSPPQNGEYPTSSWIVGSPFYDRHVIHINGDKVLPGTYRLVIGLYRPKDGSRLPRETGGDSVLLDTPIVVQ